MNSEGYKETEIGLIPEEWEVKNIGEVFELRQGLQIAKKTRYNEIGENRYPLLRIGDMIKNDFKEYIKDPPENYLTTKNDIIFTRTGQVGLVFTDLTGVLHNNCFKIVYNDSKFDKYFVYYLLKSNYVQYFVQSSVSGSVQSDLTHKLFKSFPIPIIPLNEQKTIAKILKNIDVMIELNNQMNRTLELMGQAIFRHWFVHFEFPDSDGQPYKSSGGEMVDSELGEIPAGWKISMLKDYVNLIKGCSYRSIDLQESDMALVTLKSVGRDGNFKEDGFKEYLGEFKEEQVLEDGDVVIAQTDLTQNADVLGKPVIVRTFPKYKKLIASLDLGIVRPNDSYLNKEFIFHALKTKTFHAHAVSYANGTTVLHLSKDAIPRYKLPIPNKSILHQFEKLITPINNQINNNNLESRNLSKIRDLLLPKLMSGKIRVNLPEEATAK